MNDTAKITEAFQVLMESVADADDLIALGLNEGWIHACRCGWEVPLAELGLPCEACTLIPAVDTILRCSTCSRPVIELGSTLHHGRGGADPIDTDADAHHRPLCTSLPESCPVCFRSVAFLHTGATVHLNNLGRPDTPVETCLANPDTPIDPYAAREWLRAAPVTGLTV